MPCVLKGNELSWENSSVLENAGEEQGEKKQEKFQGKMFSIMPKEKANCKYDLRKALLVIYCTEASFWKPQTYKQGISLHYLYLLQNYGNTKLFYKIIKAQLC